MTRRGRVSWKPNWSRYGMRIIRSHETTVALTTHLRPYAIARHPFALISGPSCSSLTILSVPKVCVLCPSPEPETNWRGPNGPQPDHLSRPARGYRHVSRPRICLCIPQSVGGRFFILHDRLSLDRCLVLSCMKHHNQKLRQSAHSF